MSDENSPTPSAEPAVVYPVIPYRKGGEAEIFFFTSKNFNTLAAAEEAIGTDLLLDLINSDMDARLGAIARNRAGFNKLSEVESGKRLGAKNDLITSLVAKYPTKVIFSESDAATWKPNTRELSAKGIMIKWQKAMNSGNTAEAKNWYDKLIEVLAQEQAAAAAA